MKRYPAYQDSAIEWIGQVPASWFSKRLKYVVRLIDEKGMSEDGKAPINLENIESWTGRLTSEEIVNQGTSDEEMKRFVPGDVLFNKLRPYLAKVYRTDSAEICGGELLVLRPRSGIRSSFLFYRLISKNFISVVDGATYGTKMPRASWDFIGDLRVAYPEAQEQERIADFLDRKIAQIDVLIAKKERMIELLKEERSAMINHVVTRGLDPNAGLKDSDIKWLGQIPKHWELKKLKYVGEVIIGLTYAPEEMAPLGTLVLRASNIQDGKIVLEDNVYVNKKIQGRLIIKAGDILICSRSGSRALIGKCVYIDNKYAGYSFGAFMTVFRGKSNRFVYHVFNSTMFAFHIGSFLTSTINQLTTENLNEIIIALPSFEEQNEIADFLDRKTARIDEQVMREEKSIELLKEFRTALISEVVTGKIDVRDNP